MTLRPYSLLFFLLCTGQLKAQQNLKGKVFDLSTDSVIYGINIWNISRKLPGKQDANGEYNIFASENDRIVFTSPGYKPDTVVIKPYMLLSGYDVSLELAAGYLPGVTIQGYRNYQLDSMARREYYQDAYKKQTPLTGNNAPTDGFGISVSPLSFFSSRQREKRNLKRKLMEDEEQSFVDYSFSRSYVERITNLHNDSLQVFLLKYRPTYEFCRKSNREDMLLYINASLKDYFKEKQK